MLDYKDKLKLNTLLFICYSSDVASVCFLFAVYSLSFLDSLIDLNLKKNVVDEYVIKNTVYAFGKITGSLTLNN